ncbi:LuxR family two component transcriptional regulator [Paenibacillus cellulosilyticus]|uniref:LuxR family two component transcriptional regulator n=1 Tax=Paenibacillus cellulosilyticus TaxID=375489 RepID=A0A2V2Z1E1_9BACL|nr:response regulator transcription factor [Paenibacillus cellulosilyticus]PWW08677.1 LuxR family two component transcriptional regulator [Paenibacillus cellulosilyticus]QKS48243.1 response regulator transcription factor [Paenibacillus cellulosilyticus]
MTYRILIADDHRVVREGLKLILETDPQYEVVAEAPNGTEAVVLAEQFKPDVILLDLNMPEMGGLDVMIKLKELSLDIPVIILTTFNENELMARALALGAKGYLLKEMGGETIFRSIEAAVRGETLLLPEITDKIFKDNILFEQEHKEVKQEKSLLTEKELLVLQAIARGYRSKEIGHEMGITERTVKHHLTSIYQKLAVDSRSQAVAVAIERGVLQI